MLERLHTDRRRYEGQRGERWAVPSIAHAYCNTGPRKELAKQSQTSCTNEAALRYVSIHAHSLERVQGGLLRHRQRAGQNATAMGCSIGECDGRT